MKPRYIFDNIFYNQKVEITSDHLPYRSYKINCPYCLNNTNTVPEITEECQIQNENTLTEMVSLFTCDTCQWSLRHRFILKLAANEIINKNYNLIYMPGDHELSIALIKKYLSDKKHCKIITSHFTEILHKNKSEIDQYLEDSYQDLTKLTYQDRIFDYIHCNHMLEHILDYKLAIQNLYRVLRLGGEIIITVPINYHEKFNIQWADLKEEKINWMYYPKYHGSNEFPVFWEFGIELINDIKNTLKDAKVTLENYVDHEIGLYNQGINIIRVKK